MTALFDLPDPARQRSLLPGLPRPPFYVVAPPYTRQSVGVRCLHLLTHWLNRLGHNAYLLIWGEARGLRVHPQLLAPELSPALAAHHRHARLTPIVVYPEIIVGNPLRAPVVVRYALNVPGLLGGDLGFAPSELVFGYSAMLAERAGAPGNVLHIPALDTDTFSPEPATPRSGTCHYGGKYRHHHGGELFGLPEGSIEIGRGEGAIGPSEIAALFRRCERFYVYENTALIVEACLCGCPVVMLPNPWLTAPLADSELGRDGIAWGDDPAELARAAATVGRMRDRYLATIPAFFQQLERFVRLTQARAATAAPGAELDYAALCIDAMVDGDLAGALRRAESAEGLLRATLGSTSWLVTAPLRAAAALLRGR